MTGYALPAATEEDEVLASCRTGASDGLDLLYRRYAPALTAFCQHRLGSYGEAEDAAHETILKAHRALPGFREGARLWPWLATIAANVCTDMQRARERLGPEEDAVNEFGPEVDDVVSRRVRATIVDAALDELPERFRTPLFLREFMGWSYDEIAQFSNKSVGSVRTTLMRSRRAFQARVEDVARRQGQWPLPAAVGLGGARGLRRVRLLVRQWRDALHQTGTDAANALWRAEGLVGGFGTALQAAAIILVAAAAGAATGATPAAASMLATATSATAGPGQALATAPAPAATAPRSSAGGTQREHRSTSSGAGRAFTTSNTSVTVGPLASAAVAYDGSNVTDNESDGVTVAGMSIANGSGSGHWSCTGTKTGYVLCTVESSTSPTSVP